MLEKMRALVPADAAFNTRVEEITPRAKDGGAFVRFSYLVPPTSDTTGVTAAVEEENYLRAVEKKTQEAMAGKGYKPWFTFKESRVFLVKVSLHAEERKPALSGK